MNIPNCSLLCVDTLVCRLSTSYASDIIVVDIRAVNCAYFGTIRRNLFQKFRKLYCLQRFLIHIQRAVVEKRYLFSCGRPLACIFLKYVVFCLSDLSFFI